MEEFQVGNELILEFSSPVNFGHGDFLSKGIIKELAVDSSSSKILNGEEIKGKSIINPFDDLMSWTEVGLIHDSDNSLMMHGDVCWLIVGNDYII